MYAMTNPTPPCTGLPSDPLQRACRQAIGQIATEPGFNAGAFHHLLNDLATLFEQQFRAEEQQLSQQDSPNLEQRCSEHDLFRERLIDLLCDASIGRIQPARLSQLCRDYISAQASSTCSSLTQ